jgi:hypothetical protein
MIILGDSIKFDLPTRVIDKLTRIASTQAYPQIDADVLYANCDYDLAEYYRARDYALNEAGVSVMGSV